jgi:hypothetical protein
LLGQQTGVDVPAQSALVAHATQAPLRQTLRALGHSALVKHSTQPAGIPGAVHRTPASRPLSGPPLLLLLLPPSRAPLLLPLPPSWEPPLLLLPPSRVPLLLPLPPSTVPLLLPEPLPPEPLLPEPLLPEPLLPEPLLPEPLLPEPLLPELLLLEPPLELLLLPELPLLEPLLLELLPSAVLPSGAPSVFVESPPQSISPSDRTVAKGASRTTQSMFRFVVMGTPKFLQEA